MLNPELVQKRIAELDLEPIKFKLATSDGYNANEIAVVDKWYRRFLLLAWKYPDMPVVVPEPIDAMWHHHILDTRKYAEDCATVFGQFLHHFPYFGLRGEEDARALRLAFQKTNDLMRAEFGESPTVALAQCRPEWAEEEAASSCSDCSGVWAKTTSLPQGETRPRFTPLPA